MTKRSDGLWQEAITINGKRKYFYGKTKADVLKKMRDYQEAEENGKTFSEVANDWWEEHSQKVVFSTMRGYNARFECAIEYFEGRYIKDITTQEITKLLKILQDKKYSQKVISTQLNVLNMIFNKAIVSGDIMYNPCSALQLPKGLPKKKRELPTDREFEIVENSDWLFPFFLLYTGCRRGEALAVTYEDIDWEKKVIHINKAVGFKGNIPYIKSTKTDAGCRDVVLLDKLAAKLDKSKTGLIFPDPKGEMWHESMLTRKWKQWQKRNNTTVTAHQLRHGYATILFEAGLEAKDAQYLLGHSTIAMTQDIYTHIRQTRQAEYAQKLNDFLRK